MGCGSGGLGGPKVEEIGKRTVFCVKFQREMPGLDEAPFDSHPLGQRIYENVSKEAWKMWLEQMKMIMNEYRLNLGTQEAQEFLLKQMEDYFFGAGRGAAAGLRASASEKLKPRKNSESRIQNVGSAVAISNRRCW